MRKLYRTVGVLAVTCLPWAPVYAQNVLTNPDFATATSGWSVTAGSGSLALDTHSGWPGGTDTPGSLAVTNTSPYENGTVAVVSACVDIPDITVGQDEVFPYLAVAHVSQSLQGKTGKATVGYEGYSDDACTNRLWAAEKMFEDIPPGSWQKLALDGAGQSGTRSLRMYVKLSKNEEGGSLTARFDGMYLGQSIKGDVDSAMLAELRQRDAAHSAATDKTNGKQVGKTSTR